MNPFQVETGEADSWQACREVHLGFPAGTFGDLEFGFLNWITNFFHLDTNWIIWNLASLHWTLDFWEFASQIELIRNIYS